jgi:hypothetical protein
MTRRGGRERIHAAFLWRFAALFSLLTAQMLQNVTFCYVFTVFSVDPFSRDAVAELGRLGRILLVAGHAV